MKRYAHAAWVFGLFLLLTAPPAPAQRQQLFEIPLMSGTVELHRGSLEFGDSPYVIVQFDQRLRRPTIQELQELGIKPLSFLYEGAWLCKVQPEAFSQEVMDRFGIAAAEPWKPEYKIAPQLRQGNARDWAVTEEGRIKVLVTFFEDVRSAEIERVLQRYDPSYEIRQEPNIGAIEIAPERIESLIREPAVHTVEEGPQPLKPVLDHSRPFIRVDRVQDVDLTATPPVYYGLSGKGVNIAVSESVDTNHPDFWEHDGSGNQVAPRFLNHPQTGSFHGTLVAGIIGGNGWNSDKGINGGSPYQWRGMAPEATLISGSGYTRYNVHASNHSFVMEQGRYGSRSQSVDRDIRGGRGFTYQKPHIWAAANQGNTTQHGPDTGYYSVYAPAKNSLCVGAVNAGDGSLAGFSSLGPTFDGRIKPDVMAAGNTVFLPPDFRLDQEELTFYLDYIRIMDGANNTVRSWEFNTDGDLEGCFEGTYAHLAITKGTVAGGLLSFSAGFNASDNCVDVNVNAANDHLIKMRYRVEGAPPGLLLTGKFAWPGARAPNGNTYSGSIRFDSIADGQFHEVTIPVGQLGANEADYSLPGWQGTINRLRLEPFVAKNIASTWNEGDGLYIRSQGTSEAAPAVTGTVALMLQAFVEAHGIDLDLNPPLPSTIKATLIQTATDLVHRTADPRDFKNPDTGEPVLYYQGPDFATGYGLVNAEAALDLIYDASSAPLVHEAEIEFNIHNYEIEINSPRAELKVTLAWDDVEGSTSLKQTIPRLINDLDLLLIDPSGTLHYPWTLERLPLAECRETGSCSDNDPITPEDVLPAYKGEDHRNNVEQVQVDNPQVGTWQVLVSGAHIWDVSDGPQTYSLLSDEPLDFVDEFVTTFTGGEPLGAFGDGHQTDEVTEPGNWRWAEYFYGLEDIDEISRIRDECGEHNYAIAYDEGDIAEYLMAFGGPYDRMIVRARTDGPGPVKFSIYVDGLYLTTETLDSSIACSEDIEIALQNIPYGTHAVSVIFEISGAGGKLYLDGLLVPEPAGRVVNGLQLLYTFEEGEGDTMRDRSGVLPTLNLLIRDPRAVRWLSNGGLSVEAPTLLQSHVAATRVVEACKQSGEITVEAWVKPHLDRQEGPARIVTLSRDPNARNFTVGQGLWERPDKLYDVRLRTTATGPNGMNPSLSTSPGSANPKLTHLVYTRDQSGTARTYIDGFEAASRRIEGNLSNWDESMYLGLANELSGNRPWLGEYYLVAVYSRALTGKEVEQNFISRRPQTAPSASGRATDGLAALYTFEEGTGGTVYDVSGRGRPLHLTIENQKTSTHWLSGGGLSVDASTLIKSEQRGAKIIDPIKQTRELTIEAWLRPTDVDQDGPARIVTLSRNPWERNFTLGQGLWGNQPNKLYNVRLRTTATGNNGMNPSLSSPVGSLTAELTHVVYTRDRFGEAKIYMNGLEAASANIGGDLSNWDENMYFGLANELSRNRPWLGELYLVAVYSRALSPEEVKQNHGVGPPVTSHYARVTSNSTWKSSDTYEAGWETADFDDSDWTQAYAPYPNPDQPADWIPGTTAKFMWHYPAEASEPPTGRNGPDQAWFRKTFNLDAGPWQLESARAIVGADDDFDLYVNGILVYSDWDGTAVRAPFTVDIRPYLQWGENVVAIHARDSHGIYEWVLFDAILVYQQERPESIVSGYSWKSFDRLEAGWQAPGFDDSGWRSAHGSYPNPDDPENWIPGTGASFMWDYPRYYPLDPDGRGGPREAWFRKVFTISVDPSVIKSARVVLAADDDFEFYVNGTLVYSDLNGVLWGAPYEIDIKPYLVQGKNVFAIYARDSAGLYEWALLEATIEYLEDIRVRDDLIALYTFKAGGGSTVFDVAPLTHPGIPLDLQIEDPGAIGWIQGGGLAVNSATLISSVGPAGRIIEACTASNEISIEAWLRPANIDQKGPARIVTLSRGPWKRNFTLGQGLWGNQPGDLFNIRLRTTETGANGFNPSLSSPEGTITGELIHLVYTRNRAGQARIFINGAEVAARYIGGNLSTWDQGMRFGLGNELNKDRPWLGELYLVAVYSRALDGDEVVQNFSTGYSSLPALGFRITSDGIWRSSDGEETDWETHKFDDSNWRSAYANYPNRQQPVDFIPGTDAAFIWDYPDYPAVRPNGRDGPDDAWFRKSFEIPVYDPGDIKTARVILGADDDFDFYVNGTLVYSDWDGVVHSAPFTVDVKPYLFPGKNVFAVHARDSWGGNEWLLFDSLIQAEFPRAVTLNGFQNFQEVVDSQPWGTVFLVSPGLHREQSVVPREGDIFAGLPGPNGEKPVLNGSRLLNSGWLHSGGRTQFFYHPDPLGGYTELARNGECVDDVVECRYPHDLFVGGRLLKQVREVIDVGCDTWAMYMGMAYIHECAVNFDDITDPNVAAQHEIEFSVLPFAFGYEVMPGTEGKYEPDHVYGEPLPSDPSEIPDPYDYSDLYSYKPRKVTIRNLVVEKYANPAQTGAIGYHRPGLDWIIEDNEVRWNHGVGIKFKGAAVVRGNYVHHNGQLGIGAGDGNTSQKNGGELMEWGFYGGYGGNGGLVANNEISFNRLPEIGIKQAWEGGGTKFAQCFNLTVRNNYVHDNDGIGLWSDFSYDGGLYENNLVEDNNAEGIHIEITQRSTEVRYNVCTDNGKSVTEANIYGAQIFISNSPLVEVHHNYCVSAETYGNGITVFHGDRNVEGRKMSAFGNSIHHNTIVSLGDGGSVGITGGQAAIDKESFYSTILNKFDHNTYHVANGSGKYWRWDKSPFQQYPPLLTFEEWQDDYGQDPEGSVVASP